MSLLSTGRENLGRFERLHGLEHSGLIEPLGRDTYSTIDANLCNFVSGQSDPYSIISTKEARHIEWIDQGGSEKSEHVLGS